MSMQRILVLGADGFIGRRLVAALQDSDWAMPVAGGRRRHAQPGPPERVQVDACDERALAEALRGMDGVVNCVAGKARTIVESARALFAAAARGTQPRIVHLSTMSVYGSATGEVDELAPLRGDLGPYSVAKVEAERIAATYPRAVVLRPGCVYGPGSPQWSGRVAAWLESGRIGDLGAAGDGLCNLVHVDDVVAAVLRALRSASHERQVYNLAAPQPPTWNDYFIDFARALGTVPVRRVTPRRLKIETRLLAPPLKIAEILARRARLKADALPPPIPPSLLGLWTQEIRLRVDRAEQDLGLRWKPIDTGLRETAAWYRARA